MQAENKLSLWKLSWPLCIQLLLVYGLLLTDSYFLSLISDTHAASIGAIFPILAVFYMIFNQMGQAGCSVAVQYLGANKAENVNGIYTISFLISILCGFLASIMLLVSSQYIGGWVGLKGESNQIVAMYLSIVGFGFIFEAMKSAYNGILNSLGNSMWNMFAGIFYNLVNIILNVVFLNGSSTPESRVAGVAWATVIAQVCVVLILALFAHLKMNVRFDCKELLQKFRVLGKRVLKIGIPASLEPVSVQVITYIVMIMVVNLGMEVLAARTYIVNITSLIVSWSVAVGIGTLIIVAYSVGAKDFNRANKQVHKSMLISSLVCFGVVLFIIVCSDWILGMFTQNVEIIRLSKLILYISLFWEPVRAINIVLSYSLTASGDAKFSAISGILIMFILGVPLSYLFGIVLGFGLVGIWIALFLDECLRGLVYYLRWRSRKWEKYRIVDDEPTPTNANVVEQALEG